MLQEMQDVVSSRLQTVGDSHWADEGDVSILSSRLGVGFVLLSDRVQGARDSVLKRYVNDVEHPSVWLCLHYLQDRHFQVLFLQTVAEITCTFTPEELPAQLQEILYSGHQ